ncbi:MAG: gliding motility lipoprotein GldH [Bacteroidetes bacterium]|nr:gliding motility lipoprotein GldH [Bacteroidota bacterium]
MKRTFTFIALSILILTSCSKSNIYEKRQDFDNYTWNRMKSLFFEVPVKDTESEYNIYLTVRHITQYPYDDLKVNFTIYSPSGEERTTMHTIKIKDSQGKFIGSGAGDLWDVEFLAKEKIVFNQAGTYKFQIDNLMDYLDVVGLADFGIRVEKAELKK